MESRKIVVFGSNGFVGSNVLKVLKDTKGVEVLSIDRSEDNIDFEVNLRNKTDVLRVLDKVKPQVVINCAGIVSAENCMLNSLFSMNILTSLVELKDTFTCKLIVLGSASEYGPVKSLPVSENQSLKPDSEYGMSKLIEIMSVLHYGQLTNTDVVVARLFNPVGIDMHERTLLPSLITRIRAIKEGKKKFIEVNRLDSKRDFVGVGDVAKAIVILALALKTKHKVYNIGSGKETSVHDIVITLAEKLGLAEVKTKELMKKPEPQYASCANIDRIVSEFGWKPSEEINTVLSELVL